MTPSEQSDIDARIQTYYAEIFDEGVRLSTRSPQGPLDFQRTQEIISSYSPDGRVIDIGGGSGVHAKALEEAGHDVVVVDPVPRHVEAARAAGLNALLGDARDLPSPDEQYDVALLLGPLYHLTSVSDRRRALMEASRVLKPGGMLFAVGLSRYVAFGALTLARPVPDRMPDDWTALLVSGTPSPGLRFPAGHFHTAEELQDEVRSAGFDVQEVVGIEGPAGLLLESLDEADEDVRRSALLLARVAGATPGIRDMSAHLMAIARRPDSSARPPETVVG